MFTFNNQRRWHSYGCLLHFGGGYSRNLCSKESQPSIGCGSVFGSGICHSLWHYGGFEPSELQFNKCDGIAWWSHHSSDNGSIRGTCCCVYLGVAFKANHRGGRAAHSSPTNSSKWGNTASSPCQAWRPQWQWALTARQSSHAGDCTVQIDCTPSNPLLMTGYVRWAVESPRKMTRRSPFQEGEGGVQRGNPIPGPELPAGGRVPYGPLQQSPCPALAGPDMGWLITTLTLDLCIGTPKISIFSGDTAPGKTKVSYKQWSHEVQCIKDHYTESVVRESIIRSLKGAAADMARYMGPTASVSKFWRNFQLSSARSHHLTCWCKIFTKFHRGVMKSAFIHDQIGEHFKSNQNKIPWKNSLTMRCHGTSRNDCSMG